MKVRDAMVDDAEGIAVVRVRAWQAAYRGLMPQGALDAMSIERNTVGWLRAIEEAPPRSVLVVAEDGGQILGFCSAGPGRGEPDHVGEVYAIYVHPDRWFTGSGTAMMAIAVERLAGHGFSEIVLWVLSANAPTRRFYESRGWAFTGIEKDHDAFGFVIRESKYSRAVSDGPRGERSAISQATTGPQV